MGDNVLEKLVLQYINQFKVVETRVTSQKNRITKIDDTGFYIETKASKEKYENGNKENSTELLSTTFIKEGWKEFKEVGIATSSDFIKTKARSSFLMALFSKLPFVNKTEKDGKTAISFEKYFTDQLPESSLEGSLTLLKEILEGDINPQKLSSQFSDDKTKRLKSRARQGLKLLSFLDGSYIPNERLIQEYVNSQAKNMILRRQMKKHPYFNMVLELLTHLPDVNREEKIQGIKELGMLIVQNSRGNNQMVESVADTRTRYMLSWMETAGLLDEELNTKLEESIRPLLNEIMQNYVDARSSKFANHPLGKVVRNNLVEAIYNLPFIDGETYTVKGSVGQGNWATVPWLAIMDNRVTKTTQKGYYIVYLFSEDMEHVYLTLAQGVTETSKEDMQRINKEIQNQIPMEEVSKGNNYYLGESKKARDYVESTAAYISYSFSNLPSEDKLIKDLRKMVGYYDSYIDFKDNEDSDLPIGPNPNYSDQELVSHIDSYISSKGFYYEKEEVENLFLSLKTKPFVILSGISGTGKTKIVQWFAESVGATEENGQFTLIPVRPDWSDGSDLLGYVDIKGEFQEGPLTRVIREASNHRDMPYFVLLDEMNLARVEYYFSDILSVMESKRWEKGELLTSSILPEETIGEHLGIPENLYFIGTVNMDETTHPFSKKVLDRANTIEFNRVNLKNFSFLENVDEDRKVRDSK